MTQYARLEVIPPAGVEYDPRMAVPHVIGDVEHPAHPGDPCFNVALIAPEPGADAAWEAKVFVREAFRRYWLPDADEARCVEIALGGLRAAALARPTPALDVEALADALAIINDGVTVNAVHYDTNAVDPEAEGGTPEGETT